METSNLRIATMEDIDLVVNLTCKALDSTNYKSLYERDTVTQLAQRFLSSGLNECVILLYEDHGLLAGVCSPFIFGVENVATEVGIWLEPNKRGKQAGKELLEAFEFWAKQLNCKLITLSAVDEKMKKYFEDKGYVLYEQAMVKEVH